MSIHVKGLDLFHEWDAEGTAPLQPLRFRMMMRPMRRTGTFRTQPTGV